MTSQTKVIEMEGNLRTSQKPVMRVYILQVPILVV